jgi:hypothetical protein
MTWPTGTIWSSDPYGFPLPGATGAVRVMPGQGTTCPRPGAHEERGRNVRRASVERWSYGWELPPGDDDGGAPGPVEASAFERELLGLPERPGTLR